MPWTIKKASNCPPNKPFGVVKEGESKADYCHESEAKAESQRQALYASEEKSVDGKSAEKSYYDEEGYYVPYGATTFSAAEEILQATETRRRARKLNDIFQQIVSNIMVDPEIEDKAVAINSLVDEYTQRIQMISDEKPRVGFFKSLLNIFGHEQEGSYELIDDKARTGPAMKRESNIDFPARDYAYVPDPQRPATWKLRLTESPGKVTVRQLSKAAAALSTGGAGSRKVAVPIEAVSSVKRRIRQEYRKLGVLDKDIPPEIRIDDPEPRIDRKKSQSSFLVFKDANDDYRWFSVYSNNYRDDDYPPEIISSASHRAFVKSVDEGIFPMPELWLWHTEYPIGDADWLDFTDDGLALASGTFRPGYEGVAKSLSEFPEPLATSHGMPTKYLVRDDADPSLIWFHVTKEISPLPAWAAANKLTGFVVLSKEKDRMPISDNKKEFLRSMLGDELFSDLDNSVAALGQKAADAGRESKEASEEPIEEQDPATTAEEVPYATIEEVAAAMTELVQPMVKALGDISARFSAMEATVKELQVADTQKATKLAESTPRASLAELIASQMTKEAEVKDGNQLADAQPRETPVPDPNSTGLPLIDKLIANSRGRGG